MKQAADRGFSIVVCTHNGRARLLPTFEHLAALTIPDACSVELLVVDNASTDGTADFTKAIWNKLGSPYPARVLRESRPGKGFAVELGYDAAAYSYILTVDDDNWLNQDYLQKAIELLEQRTDIGILQGRSIGEFETPPPAWFEEFKSFFVIGGPIQQEGYFKPDNYFVWGAGMVIRNKDWRKLRSLGFTFLTSKLPGKAAGEDEETAIAIKLLGGRIYYSDKMIYRHFMPAPRVTWEKLQQSFRVYGYVSYYLSLYQLILKYNVSIHGINKLKILYELSKQLYINIANFTLKQHVAYKLIPQREYYQLQLLRFYSQVEWTLKLFGSAQKDLNKLSRWISPLLF